MMISWLSNWESHSPSNTKEREREKVYEFIIYQFFACLKDRDRETINETIIII